MKKENKFTFRLPLDVLDRLNKFRLEFEENNFNISKNEAIIYLIKRGLELEKILTLLKNNGKITEEEFLSLIERR